MLYCMACSFVCCVSLCCIYLFLSGFLFISNWRLLLSSGCCHHTQRVPASCTASLCTPRCPIKKRSHSSHLIWSVSHAHTGCSQVSACAYCRRLMSILPRQRTVAMRWWCALESGDWILQPQQLWLQPPRWGIAHWCLWERVRRCVYSCESCCTKVLVNYWP